MAACKWWLNCIARGRAGLDRQYVKVGFESLAEQLDRGQQEVRLLLITTQGVCVCVCGCIYVAFYASLDEVEKLCVLSF